jgi:hypothetical protein
MAVEEADVAVESIGPDKARGLLAANSHNRNLREPRVAQLAAVMARGEWEMNGETIKVADDGTLLDGQHRLQAIVESGVEIESLVIRDLPLAAQDTVDIGRRRRLADVLAIEGKRDAHALSAGLSMLHRYRTGKRFDYAHNTAPSPKQALQLLEETPEMTESVRAARRVTKQIGGPIGVFAALHRIFSEVDPGTTEEFFRQLESGAELEEGDPVLQLRNQVVKPRQDRNYTQSPNHVAALTVKAYNLRRSGRKVDLLSYRKREKFPEIDGRERLLDG